MMNESSSKFGSLNSSGLGIGSISEFRKQIINKKKLNGSSSSTMILPPLAKGTIKPSSTSMISSGNDHNLTKYEMDYDPNSSPQSQVRFSSA